MQTGTYRHFKGTIYQVTCIATHTESGEKMAIYHEVGKPAELWVRPVAMFLEPVDKEKYPNAVQEDRFEFVQSYILEGKLCLV